MSMEPKGDLLAGVEFRRVRLILRYCNLPIVQRNQLKLELSVTCIVCKSTSRHVKAS